MTKSAAEKLSEKLGVSGPTMAEVIPLAPFPGISGLESPAVEPPESRIPANTLADVEADAKQRSSETLTTLITKLNADHFVSIEGGKASVYREAFDHELGRASLERMGVDAFKTLHSHEYITCHDHNGNTKRTPVSAAWLTSPSRRTYMGGTALLPNGNAPNDVYNLWRGFGCEPNRAATIADVKPALVHILKVICADDAQAAAYLIGWFACVVQHPERQAEVAIVLQGGRGTGKGTLGRWFRDLFGMHGMHIQHPRHLTGNFNAHLRTCLAIFVDESFFVGDKAGNSVLKSVITEDQITVEKKGIDPVTGRNRLKIIMATNEDHAILAGVDERRYFVLRVSDAKKQDHGYYGKLDTWWKTGGKEAFLGYLLSHDLTGFDIRKVPSTGALERQKLESLPPLGAWLFERLQEGKLCPICVYNQPKIDWPPEQDRKTVAHDFAGYVKEQGHRYVSTTTDAIGVGIRKYIEIGDKRESTGDRRRLWVFPPLVDARQQFAKSLKLEHFRWEEEGDDD